MKRNPTASSLLAGLGGESEEKWEKLKNKTKIWRKDGKQENHQDDFVLYVIFDNIISFYG